MRAVTINDLERAISRGEFTFHYQPKISLVDGSIAGAGALVRWRQPDGTLALPKHFIPLAEETGFIRHITAILVSDIVDHMQPLIAYRPSLKVAFNVSTADLETPYLARMLAGYMAEGRIEPSQIEIEMTEATVVANPDRVSKSIGALRSLGVSVALDDFGAGFSAFSVLCDHTFDTLKIDRQLIDSVAECPRYGAVVRSVVKLARRLNMTTVAEGIETESQLHAVQYLGCEQAQGFYLGRPMPRSELRSRLKSTFTKADNHREAPLAISA